MGLNLNLNQDLVSLWKAIKSKNDEIQGQGFFLKKKMCKYQSAYKYISDRMFLCSLEPGA